jgi:hypothetical protein
MMRSDAAIENARRASTDQSILSQLACPAILNGRRSLPPAANGDSKVCQRHHAGEAKTQDLARGRLSYRLLSRQGTD